MTRNHPTSSAGSALKRSLRLRRLVLKSAPGAQTQPACPELRPPAEGARANGVLRPASCRSSQSLVIEPHCFRSHGGGGRSRKSGGLRASRWRQASTSLFSVSSRRSTSTASHRGPPTADTGELFAQAPVDQFPGTAVESVTDSSRYFVIRIEDGNGRRAFIGIGFVDRGDAFDFNVALQDHFKWVKQQCEFAKQAQNPDQGPKLDLGFKEGQTIKLNIALVLRRKCSFNPVDWMGCASFPCLEETNI
ncbi:adaptin ear-binding coat-associated protein 2 isoform X3 [Marmota marmota marmota]|uniref:adaptin ear-binding coat-associated protein 2 isoform X3 n=1 Tax=Marmota marmota marmota TaxID=9994 RepID=UPI002093154A|nr:adaptin ear-binding coat-associated protein 2 isoform X3 [Marmota marmota marmota]